MDNWISVNEKMPLASSKYLCYNEEGTVSIEFMAGMQMPGNRFFAESIDAGQITHWQPLPSAPGEPAPQSDLNTDEENEEKEITPIQLEICEIIFGLLNDYCLNVSPRTLGLPVLDESAVIEMADIIAPWIVPPESIKQMQ